MFRRVSIRLALLGGDLLLLAFALYFASWLRPQLTFGKELPLSSVWLDWPVYGMALSIWLVGFSLFDVYNLQRNLQPLDELQRVISSHAVMMLAFAGALYFSFRDISRLQVITFGLVALLLLLSHRLVVRLGLNLFSTKRYGSRRVLIVGAGDIGQRVATMVVANGWTGLSLVGFVDDNPQADTLNYPHLGKLSRLSQIVTGYHITEVIFALPREAQNKLANQVAVLEPLGVNMRVVPDYFDLVFLRSTIEDFGDMPMVTLREPALDPFQRLIKRTFDIVVSGIALVLALPLMGLIALAIKLDSAGPVLFKQSRVGEKGRIFFMYKFRSMYDGAEAQQAHINRLTAEGKIIHKCVDDPRITAVGRIIRRLSLDELPQLFNILKGEMSLVGPRPELPWLVDEYEPWQRKRFEVPQGLTGWWQVNGRSENPMHLHTDEDLYYIKHYSLWLDLRIIWRTVRAVINRRGAF